MSKHAELIARLEAAEVGSYVLDTDVGRAVGYHVPDMPWSGWHDMNGKHVGLVPPLTVSIDAALALAGRVLPNHGPIDLTIMGSAEISIHSNDPCDNPLASAFGKSPALAICIAILRALDAQEAVLC